MSVEDPNFSRGRFRFSAAEVAAYLKKGQESQKEIDKLDEMNRLDLELEAKWLGKEAQEQVLKFYEFGKATPEERKQILKREQEQFRLEQEQFWREQPFNAALLLAVRLAQGMAGVQIPAELITNNDTSFSADFRTRTFGNNSEKWRLIIDTDSWNKKKRVAMRNLNKNFSSIFKLNHSLYNKNFLHDYCSGIALYEGNDLHIYTADDQRYDFWDEHRTRPANKGEKESYIATMRLNLEKYLNSPDEVILKRWKSPQIKQWMKDTRNRKNS
jgi:hypothetical protein